MSQSNEKRHSLESDKKPSETPPASEGVEETAALEKKKADANALIKNKISDEELEELFHKYCRDFTALERAGRFDPIFGRDEEVDDMILILLQKGRKNVCLLAPAGVGKTAMCVALAQRIVKGDVPDLLQNARLVEVDLASMAAGTSSPAEFQGRFIPLCRGVAERYHDPAYPPVILFIDEIHTIMPSVEGSAYRGLSEVMKPYLTVGDLCVIGATTVDEHRMFVAVDPAMDRRFQKIHLKIPSDPETVRILEALRPGFEKHHGISVPDNALEKIVSLTSEHMRTRNQPDKSIIVLDSSCAHYVKENGRGGEMSIQSVYAILARETGLHRGAFADESFKSQTPVVQEEGNKGGGKDKDKDTGKDTAIHDPEKKTPAHHKKSDPQNMRSGLEKQASSGHLQQSQESDHEPGPESKVSDAPSQTKSEKESETRISLPGPEAVLPLDFYPGLIPTAGKIQDSPSSQSHEQKPFVGGPGGQASDAEGEKSLGAGNKSGQGQGPLAGQHNGRKGNESGESDETGKSKEEEKAEG